MTDLDYEDVYREAVLCLRQTCAVGEPFWKADGSRVCEVCGQLLSDDEVLERWWGKSIAGLIKYVRNQHPPSRPVMLPSGAACGPVDRGESPKTGEEDAVFNDDNLDREMVARVYLN
jgi:hypothetical protein